MKFNAKESYLKYSRDYQRLLRKKTRKEALEKLGNKCIRCGIIDWLVLQIDHVNGGGTKEGKKFKNRFMFHKKIARGEIETSCYQILCANCNWIKRYENNETTHI